MDYVSGEECGRVYWSDRREVVDTVLSKLNGIGIEYINYKNPNNLFNENGINMIKVLKMLVSK